MPYRRNTVSIFPRVKYQLTQPCLFEQQLTDKRKSEARQTMKVKVYYSNLETSNCVFNGVQNFASILEKRQSYYMFLQVEQRHRIFPFKLFIHLK